MDRQILVIPYKNRSHYESFRKNRDKHIYSGISISQVKSLDYTNNKVYNTVYAKPNSKEESLSF